MALASQPKSGSGRLVLFRTVKLAIQAPESKKNRFSTRLSPQPEQDSRNLPARHLRRSGVAHSRHNGLRIAGRSHSTPRADKDLKIYDNRASIRKRRLQGPADYRDFAPLAQSVEHLTFNQVVVGSIPTGRTIHSGHFATVDWSPRRQSRSFSSITSQGAKPASHPGGTRMVRERGFGEIVLRSRKCSYERVCREKARRRVPG